MVKRTRSEKDRRSAEVRLTTKAGKVIRELSLHHRKELRSTIPALIHSLEHFFMNKSPNMSASSPSGHGHASKELGDFTATSRMLLVCSIGHPHRHLQFLCRSRVAALIGLFTNLFYFQRWSTALVSPAGHHLGCWAILVPVVGGLIIGLMARYGSERIRGHGIPEAIEAILLNGSRVQPRVAMLKPLSSAISIGSGGPFGAEGPIIMTGGAFGSLIAQLFHLTSAERKTLLVAGAAAGMSATFASPIAAVLLAVELLLFEWKPRSLIPVALASATAAAARRYIARTRAAVSRAAASVVHRTRRVGSAACSPACWPACSPALLTRAVYAVRRCFREAADPLDVVAGDRRPGGRPRRADFPAGAGRRLRHYRRPAAGRRACATSSLGVLVVKSAIWAVSLGSGTSGGVLAPLLMMGGALGGVEADVPAGRRRRVSGRWSAWARSWAARCARRSPASFSPSSSRTTSTCCCRCWPRSWPHMRSPC